MNSTSFNTRAWTPTRPAAAGALFWFNLLALVIGLAQLIVGEPKITQPVLAVAALTWLIVSALLTRALPSLKRRFWARAALDTLALLIFAAGLAASTGGVHSPLLTLLLLPLTAAAVALGRFLYGVLAVATISAAIALGAITPGVTVASSAFIVLLISALAPALIATTAIAMLIEQMQGAEQHIQDLRAADLLTGLANRRAFDEALAREHRRAERHSQSYSVIAVNVANTAEVNAFAGREGGDQLIIAVATAIGRSIRSTDLAARYDGDEFAVLLVGADTQRATNIAQRIRSNVYAGTLSLANRLVRANIHLGVASFPKDRRDALEVFVLAEQRMRHDRALHKTEAVG